jgi:hypothetical protein
MLITMDGQADTRAVATVNSMIQLWFLSARLMKIKIYCNFTNSQVKFEPAISKGTRVKQTDGFRK